MVPPRLVLTAWCTPCRQQPRRSETRGRKGGRPGGCPSAYLQTGQPPDSIPRVGFGQWPGVQEGVRPVDVRWIGPAGVTEHPVDELAALLGRDQGLVWVDIPSWDTAADRYRPRSSSFIRLAIRDCEHRNQVPGACGDHTFVVLHAPHAGAAGHVHYVELDQFIGHRHRHMARSTRRCTRPPR